MAGRSVIDLRAIFFWTDSSIWRPLCIVFAVHLALHYIAKKLGDAWIAKRG